jgi:hypothetical protein
MKAVGWKSRRWAGNDGGGRMLRQKHSGQPYTGRAMRGFLLLYASPHPSSKAMIRCNLSTLIGRDKFRISDVVRETGLNSSTISAVAHEKPADAGKPRRPPLKRIR